MALSTGLSNPDPTIKLPPRGDLSLDRAAVETPMPAATSVPRFTGPSTPISNDQPLLSVLSGGQIGQFVDQIIKQEGGSPAGVINNPGNIKFANLPGQIDSGVRARDGGTFASYASPQDGHNAIVQMVHRAAVGGSPIYGPSPTVGSFLQRYQGKGISDEGLTFGPSAQSQEAAQQVQKAKRDEAASLDQRAKEAIAALDSQRGDLKASMQRIRAAQDAATQSLQATMKAVQSPPRRPELDSLQKFGSLATVVGILGGLLTKSPMRGSLNAAAAAIEAYNSGDQTAYRQAFEQWKTQTDLLAHISDMQSRMLNDIVQDEKMSIDEQRLQFDLRLRALGLHDTANQLRTSAWEDAQNFAQTYDKANFELKKAQQEMIKQANAKWVLASGVDPDGKVIQFEFNPEMPGGGVRDLKTAEPLPFMPTDIQLAGTRSAGATKLDIYDATDPQGEPIQVLYDPNMRGFTDFDHNPLGFTPTNVSRASSAGQGRWSEDAMETLVTRAMVTGDQRVLSSLPRGGPARKQFEETLANKLKDVPGGISGGVAQMVMNDMRMTEAKSAAQQAGRVTMNTHLYSAEAAGAARMVVEASKGVPRTEIPAINAIEEAGLHHTGRPNIVQLGVAINSLLNAYGKMSNPTGTGIHDADKSRLEGQLSAALSQGQIEAGVDQIVKEGINLSQAAENAQVEVLKTLLPVGAGGSPTVDTAESYPVPSGHENDPDGMTYNNGKFIKRGNRIMPNASPATRP